MKLSRLIAIAFITCLTIITSLVSPNAALADTNYSLAALPIVKDIFAGTAPDNLGVKEGHLAACPTSPNCVVSHRLLRRKTTETARTVGQNGDESHSIEPIPYQSDRETAKATLLKVLSVVPRTEIVEQTDDYIRAESMSRIMGFIDDVEFYFPAETPVIQLRSASRLGESDLGVNRRRLEQIRLALADLAI
ncbi:MAG TPA: DUF1499 domain-containing protein [Xenococcaceae cyanobacterium]